MATEEGCIARRVQYRTRSRVVEKDKKGRITGDYFGDWSNWVTLESSYDQYSLIPKINLIPLETSNKMVQVRVQSQHTLAWVEECRSSNGD